MNSPRFKIGDKVCRPEFWGSTIVTVSSIDNYTPDLNFPDPQIDSHPYIYEFVEANNTNRFKDGAWDYQLVPADVYLSPLQRALDE